MSKPTGLLLQRLRPDVLPFERYNSKNPETPRSVLVGEALTFPDKILPIIGTANNNLVIFSGDESDRSSSMYLWIIDENGLRILLESTPNLQAARGIVCHSNITGGEPALQGGEVWFLSEDSILLNFRSGRYGADTPDHEEAVELYWSELGFTVMVE